MNKNDYPDRIKRKSNCIRSDTVHLGHPIIKTPLIRSICKSKTRNWGNSKLLGRLVITVFNVPFPYIYHFPNFSKSVESCPWQATTQFSKFEPVPIYLELSFILFAKFLLFLMAKLEAKNLQNTKLFYMFGKV